MFEERLSVMIPHRRSVRSYHPEPVGEMPMTGIRAFLAELQPLIPGAKVEARIIPTEHASFLQKWRNPQFFAFYAEESEDALLNVGFMYQQLDLYLQSIGLGTCWVGLGWPDEKLEPAPEGMKLAVMMAFGHPAEVPQRSGADDFKRRTMEEISDLPDPHLEPVRLAPSATNSQPWRFVHEGADLHIYREKLGPLKQRTLGRMNVIDTGIGLAHLYVTHPESFRFFRAENPPAQDGLLYMGSVAL